MPTTEEIAKRKPSAEKSTLILPSLGAMQDSSLRLEIGAKTHVGKVRGNNEDQYLIVRAKKLVEVLDCSLPEAQCPPLPDCEGYSLLVADGMGGRAAGEIASAIVVQEALKHIMETAKWFFRLNDPDEEVRLRLLRETLERVDRKLIEAAEDNPALAGMGTTLTAATIVGPDLFIVHVGDSRAYLLRDGHLEQLTKDHTITQGLIDRGLIRPEEAKTNRWRNVVTNVLGGKPGVEGEITKLRLMAGDRFLLCTDGLTGPVRDGRVAEILSQNANPADAADALVEAALDAGGPDNITVVVTNVAKSEAK